MLVNILDNVVQTDPASVVSAAHASRTMYAKIRASGKLKTASLLRQANDAWRNQSASEVVDNIIADAKASALSAQDRVTFISYLSLLPMTLAGAKGIIEMVERLRPEHQVDAVRLASAIMRSEYGEENTELFDRLAKVLTSLPSRLVNSRNMELVERIGFIPESERLDRFKSLALVSQKIEKEKEKAESMGPIGRAIGKLPPEAMTHQFTQYADLAQSFQSDENRVAAASGLVHCIESLPENDRRTAFNALVSIHESADSAVNENFLGRNLAVIALRNGFLSSPSGN